MTGETNACLIDVPDGRHGVKYAEAIASIGGEARDAAFHAVLHVNPRRLDALAAVRGESTRPGRPTVRGGVVFEPWSADNSAGVETE